MNSDRRRTPRVRPEGIAYINFEPDNGGIVLDISEDGLCFQSVAPVPPEDAIRLWFSAEGNRIAVEGRLAWIDEKRKAGGLHFNALSADAHRQIQDWITQSARPFAAEKKRTMAVPSVLPPAATTDALSKSGASTIAAIGQAAWNTFFRWLRARVRWTEFSRGLVAGLLVSVLVMAAFLFHMHRRQVGDLLIRMGERFGATPQQPALPSIPVQATAQQRSVVSEPASKAAPRAKKPLPQPVSKLVQLAPSKSEARGADSATAPLPPTEPLPMGTRAVGLPTSVELAKVVRPEPAGHPGSEAKFVEPKHADPSPETSEAVAELNSGIPLGKYLEIGRFKDEVQAHETIDDLARVSVHAIVVPKNLLWMTLYQVLVGPYGNEEEARSARKDLQTQGFKARSLPRRSREFTLPSVTKRKGDADTSEDFVVSWEAYSPDATVKFVRGGHTVASGRGKWVKRPNKYQTDGIMHDRNANGSRTLLEIWFRGMSQDLVFPATSSDHPIIF